MNALQVVLSFGLTAVAEIVGCYLVYAWLRQDRSVLLLFPATASLAAFAWLLTFHPTGAGRTYAAYGGVYVAAAIGWAWLVEKQVPDRWDVLGGLVSLVGMAIIAFAPHARMPAP